MIKAKKKFGQNFLKNETFVGKIIESMSNKERIVVEIGPGLGDLTKKLVDSKDKIIAFEVDKDLCEILQNLFKKELNSEKLTLRCGDVLEEWKEQNLFLKEYDLVANLPYYIATKIILKALEDSNCKNILVMVQKEVAQKFCAKVNDKEFSALSILANSIGVSEILFDVPPIAFDPPPKVTSSILKIVKNRDYYGDEKSLFNNLSEFKDFQEFLKVSFVAPRKRVIKNLSSKFNKELLEAIFNKHNINITFRPHQLLISNYHLIFNDLYLKRGNLDGEKEL